MENKELINMMRALLKEEIEPVKQDINQMKQDINQMNQGMVQMEHGMAQMKQSINQMGTKIDKNTILLENLNEKVQIIAEVQTAHKEQADRNSKIMLEELIKNRNQIRDSLKY